MKPLVTFGLIALLSALLVACENSNGGSPTHTPLRTGPDSIISFDPLDQPAELAQLIDAAATITANQSEWDRMPKEQADSGPFSLIVFDATRDHEVGSRFDAGYEIVKRSSAMYYYAVAITRSGSLGQQVGSERYVLASDEPQWKDTNRIRVGFKLHCKTKGLGGLSVSVDAHAKADDGGYDPVQAGSATVDIVYECHEPPPTPQPTAAPITTTLSTFVINGNHYDSSQFEKRKALFNGSKCESDYYGAKTLRHIPAGEPDRGVNSMFFEPKMVFSYEEPDRPDPLTPGVCGFGTVEELEPVEFFRVDLQTVTAFCDVFEGMLSKNGIGDLPAQGVTSKGACRNYLQVFENLNRRQSQ